MTNSGFRLHLSPSRRARQAHWLAAALTAAAAAACAFAFVLSPSVSRAAVALAALAAAAIVAARPAASWIGGVDVDADGTVRVDSEDGSQSATVGYCGPRFICLRAPGGAVGVWADALGAADWRRLHVACRWARGHGGLADGKARTK
jgi:hypothetical protein